MEQSSLNPKRIANTPRIYGIRPTEHMGAKLDALHVRWWREVT